MEENKAEKETPQSLPAQPQAQTQQSASPKMRAYFDSLRAETKRALESATAAREKALDAETEVEVFLAPDLASRVEGLVGPTGVAERVRALSVGLKREEVAFGIAKEIMDGGLGFENATEEKRIEQAVRTGLAVFTEGVVSAPIEGVSQVRVRKNSDGSRYLGIYFAGPIRGAGGTGQAMTLLLGDYCRKLAGLENYRPLGDVVERYVEECNLYALRTRVGQYQPTEEEVRHVVTSCPVCIDGEPTEDYEVGVHKNVEGIESNRVRGGVYLVISEGVCLKASKVMSIARKLGLDWSWLERLIKVAKQEAQRVELKPTRKYMDEIVGGRPIFAHPMRAGGFRLRYGRTRFMGIQAKATHPASMEVLDEFPAFGTQLKTERPGKACIITPCSAVEPPVVLFEDGEVKQINSVEEAIQAKPRVKKILFLGDLLVSYGDFKQTNHPLAPSAWCEEWMQRELQSKGIEKTIEEIRALTFEQARKLALETGVPLAPKYTFFWSDLTLEQLKRLAGYLGEATLEYDWFEFKRLHAPLDERKEILEMLCIPHAVREGEVVIEKENALALLETLSLLDAKSKNVSTKKFLEALQEFERSLQAAQENPAAQPPVAQGENQAIAVINSVAPFKIRAKTGLYIGASMGRPEKSRPREMKPPVHALFPIGWNGGKTRDIARGVRDLKQKDKSEQFIEVDAGIRVCVSCKKKSFTFKCGDCGSETIAASECATCGGLTVHESRVRRARGERAQCKAKNSRGIECGGKLVDSGKTRVDLVKEFTEAAKRVNFAPSAVKGVVGLISLDKTVEPLEKGILRSKHEINVFRDGTVRFDATEIPLTHFTPDEIGVSVEEAKRLGYDEDYLGKPLESGSQTVELFPQDVVLSKNAGVYLLQISRFVDDLLTYHYGLSAYYNAKTPRDLLGQVVIVIAPHTSAGIVARVIGFTDVQGILAHPYLHCATRRNADGDEDGFMLLMDAFLNFSRHYLPASRGGQMDTPLVLIQELDPSEVDRE
ncbi:DNA polymerase II large subunit, partial [Candidatus Micrarchaeota archaeon]|nr:DNA polymerase II large subunit [Candidatus Micrarchaeota archaeon]